MIKPLNNYMGVKYYKSGNYHYMGWKNTLDSTEGTNSQY